MKAQKTKKRGPVPTGKGQMLGVRLHDDLMVPLDVFISHEPGKPSRPEAIRRLVREGLIARGILHPDPQEGTLPEDLNASNDD